MATSLILSQKQRTGIGLVVLSFVIWGCLAILPFIDITYKVQIGVGIYATSYLVFFIGSYLAGKELMTQLKARFFKKKSPALDQEIKE